MTTPFRIAPQMPAHAYRTYQLVRPRQTHYRRATCGEVKCQHHLAGWQTTLDVNTELGARQANYIRLQSGRSYTLAGAPDGRVVFTFPAGQQCFIEHRVPLEREPLYIVRGGDHRGNPLGDKRVHTRPEHWVEDFATHQDTLSTEIRKG